MNGVIIGRFMPPHNGHLYLFDFARHMVDTLYILVCTLSHEPIPGYLRFQWVKELAPTCEVIHITEEIPEARRGATGATAIWARTVERAVPNSISHVFASEAYGWELARELKATFIPVDPSRNNIPVSATAVRRDPFGTWQFIPPVVRPYFVKHLAVVGDSERTEELARGLHTVVVHSYRRFLNTTWTGQNNQEPVVNVDQRGTGIPENPGTPVSEDLVRRGISATAIALARHAHQILLYDVPTPRDLSEIEKVDAVVSSEDDREACQALVPERPVFDVSTVTGDLIRQSLLDPVRLR